jgi:hypothetical protein
MRPLLPAALAVGFILSGCGGSGGGSGGATSNPVQAQQLLAQATAELNSAISNPNQIDYSLLETAARDFQISNAESPTPQAAVGVAIAEPIAVGQELATSYGNASGGTSGSPMMVQLLNELPVWTEPSKSLIVIPNITSPHNIFPTTIFGVLSEDRVKIGIGPHPTIGQILKDVEELNKGLTEIIGTDLTTANILALENKPLVIIAPVPSGKGWKLEKVKIGSAEGFTARAALEALKGTTDLILAYNLNYGNFDFGENFVSTFPSEVQSGTPIPTSSYLPKGFLQLQSESDMKDTGVQWLNGDQDATSALDVLTTRMTTHSTGWIADVYGDVAGIYSQANINAAQRAVTNFKKTLTQPTSLGKLKNSNGNLSPSLTLNLAAWIGPNATPPASLLPFFPSVTTSVYVNGTHYHYSDGNLPIGAVEGTIDDPTYGGLLKGLTNSDATSKAFLYSLRMEYKDVSQYPVVDYQVALVASAP